jgi:hypothetical protein
MSDELFGPALRAHLERQRDPAAPGDPKSDGDAGAEPESELERRERELAERERDLGALDYRLAEVSSRLRAEQEALAAREQDVAQREALFLQGNARPVRAVLRERAELFADRLWRVFDEALEATTGDGTPDFATRVAAVQALLAEAYASGDRAGEAPLDLPDFR